jgi:hypothetical protein
VQFRIIFQIQILKADRVAQVVECWPSKGEALSSNPQYCQKKMKSKLDFNICKDPLATQGKICTVSEDLWRVDYEKPVRTGHKQGEMQLNCFS